MPYYGPASALTEVSEKGGNGYARNSNGNFYQKLTHVPSLGDAYDKLVQTGYEFDGSKKICLTTKGEAPRGPRDRVKDCVYPPALFSHPPLHEPKIKRLSPRPIMVTVQSSPNRVRTATADGRTQPMDASVPETMASKVSKHGFGRTPMGGYYRKSALC